MEAASILICEFSNVVTPSENKLHCLLRGAFKTLKKPKLILVVSLCNSFRAPMSHKTEAKDHRMVISRERIEDCVSVAKSMLGPSGPAVLEGDTSPRSQGWQTETLGDWAQGRGGLSRSFLMHGRVTPELNADTPDLPW